MKLPDTEDIPLIWPICCAFQSSSRDGWLVSLLPDVPAGLAVRYPPMVRAATQVSLAELNQLLAGVGNSSPGGAAGIFGPESVSWKVNRESALFLAAGRAALLQLAHPWVSAAIAEHSRTLNDPIGRFHQTFRVMFTMMFGSLEQALATARQMHRRHDGIQGQIPHTVGRFREGEPYQANEIEALRWVYATLVESALLAYELMLPRLSDKEREQYYTESWKTAALFGIPRESLPSGWREFSLYWNGMLESETLGVSDATRGLARQLQAGAGMKMPPPRWYQALTIDLLPPRIRGDFQFVNDERERRSADRFLRWLRRLYPRLPAAIRFVGPYNEAQARLRGSAHPSLAVRLSNRLWIGRPSLLGDQSDSE